MSTQDEVGRLREQLDKANQLIADFEDEASRIVPLLIRGRAAEERIAELESKTPNNKTGEAMDAEQVMESLDSWVESLPDTAELGSILAAMETVKFNLLTAVAREDAD